MAGGRRGDPPTHIGSHPGDRAGRHPVGCGGSDRPLHRCRPRCPGCSRASWTSIRASEQRSKPLSARRVQQRLSVAGNPLDGIVLVLWEPQDVVNIAGTVRAMKNFGLRRLRLVSPAEFDAWRIEGIAHDTAEIVAAAELYDDLRSALSDCTFTIAMTARGRRAKRAVARPRDIAPEVLRRADATEGTGPIAIVFGREDIGLPNWALDLCHRSVTIPTNPEHPSLNLAQAVLVIGYELWMAYRGEDQEFKAPRRSAPPPNVQLLEGTFEAVEQALWRIDFFKSRQTESVMRTLRELAHRSDLDQREASFLRAIAIEVRKYFDREVGGKGGSREDTKPRKE
ncbi:MAG: TrmJ/YjtD family RNA methyltransferase [Gemmatimonas sp.]|nr:TrmJ/YjtD family RNA methyltransferase [Gemmatimonas sp.]